MGINIVSRNVLERIFCIRVGDSMGTAFVVDYADKNYLVTAKHLFQTSGYQNKMNINIQYENIWKPISAEIYYHETKDIDVAVIKTDFFKDRHFCGVKYESKEVLISQEVFLLGFPYGLSTNQFSINKGYPIPIVKKGIFSGTINNNNNTQVYLIDWDNNHGFSGGPLVFRKIAKDGYSDDEYIAGVIHGYQQHKIKVYNEDGSDTGLTANENSGIGFIYKIENVMEIIKKIEKN